MVSQRSDSGVALAELFAAFSLATDLGLGQPVEHVLRAWQIAKRLAPHVGLPDDQRPSLFSVSMLAWVGCVADSRHLVCRLRPVTILDKPSTLTATEWERVRLSA